MTKFLLLSTICLLAHGFLSIVMEPISLSEKFKEKSIFQDFLKIKDKVDKTKEKACIGNATKHEGRCYHFSKVKMDWEQANRYCRTWANGSLVVIDDLDELEFLRSHAHSRSKNASSYWLVGLRSPQNTSLLYWLNSLPLAKTVLSQFHESHRPERNKCGVLVFYRDAETVIENRPCHDNTFRFVCKYTLDHCYKNKKCAPGGSCVNAFLTYACLCNFFSEGSDRAIQTFMAATIGVIAFIALFLSDCANRIKTYRESKEKEKRNINNEYSTLRLQDSIYYAYEHPSV